MKAVVIGAGIAGLATAVALGRAGWEIIIAERAHGPRLGGYMIDFFGPGYDAAEQLGLLPDLARHGHDIDAARFVDEAGQTRAVINYPLARKAAGGRLFSIMRGDIEKVLLDHVPAQAELRSGTSIATIDEDNRGVEVTLSDGSRIAADLLVGADGIHSEVRRRAFGEENRFMRYLGYHTAAYFFRDAEVTRKIKGGASLLNVPNRLIGLYDVGDGTVASFFVFRAAGVELPSDPRAALRRGFGDLGWLTPATLAAAPDPAEIYYDVVAQIELPRWHAGRTVLVGDAAYAVSLLAGQGASLAIAGGKALAEAVAAGDVAAGLDGLEAVLRQTVLAKQRAGRRTADWFVPPSRGRIAMRNLALRLVDTPVLSGLLGRFFSFGAKGFSVAAR